ncbi:MAG: pectate lyase [Verrucomicrobiales bacterium]
MRFIAILACGICGLASAQTPDANTVKAAMRKATTFYTEKVARNGGYVYYTATDFSWRHGEGRAEESQIWVQPPGTPTVGMAYLTAYEATRDYFYLAAATTTGEALIHGQLESGAWTNSVCFDPASKLTGQYRNGKGKGRNSLGKTGNYPTYDWRTEGRIKEYWDLYTLNDDLAMSVTDTLFTAHRVYKDDKYLEALKRFGDFLILAQMPEPQPGWAQQYNYEVQPVWARKFEPPAISGRETEGVLATLMKLAVYTKDKKYLEPIPAALAWLKRSALPNGQLARYYELETNKPLYMERSGKVYSLTHDDSNLPSHYGWKNDAQIVHLEATLAAIYDRKPLPDPVFPPESPDPSVAKIISELNADGAWISTFAGEPLSGQPKFQTGEKYIHSGVFSRNMELLSAHLKTAP